jgi:50S ribosomal protein L16 3-hydroxylase
VLAEWLAAISVDDFRATAMCKTPVAQPATASAARAVLDWDVLDRVLRAQPDVLVVARGSLLELPAPRSVVELRAYLAAGVGLCVRHTERHDPGLARVAASFDELGTAQVQLFVTPGGTYGFGWHYDDEEVFIAQTAGAKEYYFRANTVAADQPARAECFARYQDETSQLCAATLLAGDFLYLPGRWWHMAVCREDALSISVGVQLSGGAPHGSATPPCGRPTARGGPRPR